jgi:hypothetical protein
MGTFISIILSNTLVRTKVFQVSGSRGNCFPGLDRHLSPGTRQQYGSTPQYFKQYGLNLNDPLILPASGRLDGLQGLAGGKCGGKGGGGFNEPRY